MGHPAISRATGGCGNAGWGGSVVAAMELTPDQVRAAQAAGRILRPATEEQVGRLTMQRRIFTVGGLPHVVARGEGGFLETHGTLAPVLDDPEAIAPPGETVQEAAAEDASASLAVAAENRGGRGGAQFLRRGRPRGPRGGLGGGLGGG